MEVAFVGVETIALMVQLSDFSVEPTFGTATGMEGLTSLGGDGGALPRAAEAVHGFLGEAVVTAYPETVAKA